MALKDITDKVSPVWQTLKGIATGSKIISSEWNTVIENIAERTQYLRRRGVCDWDSTLSYSVGDYVQVSGVVYKSLAANANNAPTSNPTIWETCYLTKAEVKSAVDLLGYAPLASPALTGAPTAPTAAVDTSTTQVATTAFVTNQASASTPLVDGTAAVGTSKRYARADHVHPTDTTRATVANFANSKAENGWQKLEGGLIIQWGKVGFAANNTTAVQTTVAFPIAFPSACVHISGVQTSRASIEGGGTWAMRPTNRTLANFLATLDNNGGNTLYNFTLAQTAEWIAIGY